MGTAPATIWTGTVTSLRVSSSIMTAAGSEPSTVIRESTASTRTGTDCGPPPGVTPDTSMVAMNDAEMGVGTSGPAT